MRILYIFPHPDDESFGPALAISKQKRNGDKVFLLTLTKGGATKQRHKYNYSIEQMGEVREKEMLEVKKVLNLDGMKVLDFPDSGLSEMDPREIESAIKEHIEEIRPNIVVTYAVHGISGFHDHLVGHSVVKRVYIELKEKRDYLKRLAFTTVNKEDAEKAGKLFKLNFSKDEEIDCTIKVDQEDIKKFNEALDCYKTYIDVINESGVKDIMSDEAHFEFFQEDFTPPVSSLSEGL